jgi:methionyl-tRNA formyltransferase
LARLAFLGTPEVAVTSLAALLAAGHEITVVVTEPDRRRGRGRAVTPTPAKAFASWAGIPVSERVEDVLGSGAELGVVVGFGRLIRPPVLERLGFVNVHFSLLPRWRGAAPVERAILAGDSTTGVSLMRLDEGLDTGAVYATRALPIGEHEHAGALRRRLAAAGAELLVERLANGPAGLGQPVAQEGEATYADKITPEQLELDWTCDGELVERVVRIERAWTTWRGRRLIVWDGQALGAVAPAGEPGELRQGRVATGDGWLELLEVQSEGRARQSCAAWWNGARPEPGERFGPLPEPTEPPPA